MKTSTWYLRGIWSREDVYRHLLRRYPAAFMRRFHQIGRALDRIGLAHDHDQETKAEAADRLNLARGL